MHLPKLHISTQPPATSKDSWIKQGLNQHNCCFIGYVSNAQALREMLFSDNSKAHDSQGDSRQDDSQGLAQLIDMAVQRWGHKVNQYLHGDYVIAWFDENLQNLCITASARASFSLFYRIQKQKDDQIAVACDIKALHQTRNTLNPEHWLQQLSLGPLIDRHTYLDNIGRLQPGETIIWDLNAYKCSHQIKLEGEQQLKSANQALSECFNSVPTISLNSNNNSNPSTLQLFNGLPQVAHHLGEPIDDALLAQFDWQISQCDAPIVKLDQSWFAGRLNIDQQPFVRQEFNSKVNWQKSIIRDSLLKYRRQISRKQDDFYTAFEVDNQGLPSADKLDFAQWLDLHFVIPAWAQRYQRIANGYGKTVINPFMQGQNALAMINSSTAKKQRQAQQERGFFNIDDSSMCNIYDAMQRLFRNGEKTSQQWFRLTPTVTAKFIKQSDKHSDPRLSRLKLHRPVEQTCIAMLTFDYLTKFHRNHIDSEIDLAP